MISTPFVRRVLLICSVLPRFCPAVAEASAAESSSASSTSITEGSAADPAQSSAGAGSEPTSADASTEEKRPKGAVSGVEDIEVHGERATIRQRLLTEPQADGTVTRQEMERSDGLFLEEGINLIPGVRMESRSVSGGQRITIRGYGNSTNFNGTGYKAYVNGIPITDAEGTTILDDVDASTIGFIEVIRGPASSLYGAGVGGVVRMTTIRPEPNKTRFIQELIGGTESLFRSNTRIEHGTDNSALLLNYGHQNSIGYRVHQHSIKDYVLLSADVDISPKQSLSVYGAYNHSFEQLAGQLTEDQFLAKENVAEPDYLANDAHVLINSLRFGVSHSYEFIPAVNNVTSAYMSGYQLDQPFANGRTDNMALNFGGRTVFGFRAGGPSLGVAGVLGGEIQQTNSFKKSYNQPGGVLGAIRGDLEVAALQGSPFTQWDLHLPYELTLTAGVSLNFVHYDIKDRLANSANPPPNHFDQSGVKDFTPIPAPRVALLKEFGREISVYGQVSRGFTPPSSGSVVIPQIGAVNTDLKPERAWLYELGTKGNLLGSRLWYEAAVFDMEITDKFTPQAVTSPTGTVLYTITTNAGRQQDLGLELGTKYAVISDKDAAISLLQPFATYSFSNFRYRDFKSDNNNNANTIDYSGNKVVGVPQHLLNLGLDVASRWGLYAYVTYQYVDTEPLTYDNAHWAKSYSLLSAKLGYRKDLGSHFRLDAFAGGNNLLNSLYYTFVFLNASYAGPPPNIYLNGPYSPTFYGGVNLSYSL